MGIIGILTCEILELEFAYLLARDSDVARITVLEDLHSARLLEALEATGYPHLYRIPHVKGFRPEPSGQVEVLVRVLEFALHRKKEILQHALIRSARELRPYVDAMLLGYGLCGNALENPVDLLDVNVPVYLPMDGDHPVDDCVGLLLGGRACYYAEQCQVPGTFFMLPGWTHHWKTMFGANFCGSDPEMARRLLTHYERALLVLTPVMPAEAMRRQTEEFIRFFDLRVEARQGTLRILNDAWNAVKANVTGRSKSGGDA